MCLSSHGVSQKVILGLLKAEQQKGGKPSDFASGTALPAYNAPSNSQAIPQCNNAAYQSAPRYKEASDTTLHPAIALQSSPPRERAANPSDPSDFLLWVFGFSLVASLLLTIPGTIWGLQKKVVVYTGNIDLALSFMVPIFFLLAFPAVFLFPITSMYGASPVDLGFAPSVNWTLKVLSAVLLIYSVKKSFVANLSISKTIVAVPTKLVLACLISFFSLLALGGLLGGVKALHKKNRKEAIENFAVGIGGTLGFLQLRKIIGRLIQDQNL
jgi:hypothetical protein